eukprot:3884893-Karenia_brevis.AAC.1
MTDEIKEINVDETASAIGESLAGQGFSSSTVFCSSSCALDGIAQVGGISHIGALHCDDPGAKPD